jgi:hypothetical protein
MQANRHFFQYIYYILKYKSSIDNKGLQNDNVHCITAKKKYNNDRRKTFYNVKEKISVVRSCIQIGIMPSIM